MTDLLRIMTLVWSQVLLLVAGQTTLIQAVNRLYAQLTGEDVVGNLEYIRSQSDFIAAELTGAVGLAALDAKLTTIINTLDGIDTDAVLAAIAALPAGSDLVIPTPAENATGVWDYVNGASPAPGTYTVAGQLAEAWGVTRELYTYAAPSSKDAPHFVVENPGGVISALSSGYGGPRPDYSRIGEFASVVDWLNGTDTSAMVWELEAGTNLPISYGAFGGANLWAVRCLLRDADLYPSAAGLAPVWPGLAGVTLGAPVALADQLVVVGPMQGVLVDLTSAPVGGGDWPVGTMTQYYNWGQVGFESDNGELEPFQWLGWRFGIYMPRQMAESAAAHFRVTRSPVGTVTPFTIP